LAVLACTVALSFVATDTSAIEERYSSPAGQVTTALLSAAALGAGSALLGEVRQLKRGFWDYFADPFNYLKLARAVLGIATAAVWFTDSGGFAEVLAVTTAVQYLGVFYYMQVMPASGTLIRMIVAIFYEIRMILVILAIALLSFANAMYVLTHRSEAGASGTGFDTLALSFYTSYKLVFLNTFEDDNFVAGDTRVLRSLLLCFITLLGPVVLLNLMIARMSDSYEQIQDDAEKEMRRIKAKFILELEKSIAAEGHAELFPTWVHVLVKKGTNVAKVANEMWAGVLADVKQSVEVSREELDSKIETVNSKIEIVQTEMQTEMQTVNSTIEAVDSKIEAVDSNIETVDSKLDQLIAMLAKKTLGAEGDANEGFGFS
jgi:hypothetical protein